MQKSGFILPKTFFFDKFDCEILFGRGHQMQKLRKNAKKNIRALLAAKKICAKFMENWGKFLGHEKPQTEQ